MREAAKGSTSSVRAASDFVWLLVIIVACVGSVTGALSQTASEYQVKAAYLFNFAKATQWPDNTFPSPDSALVIGVYGGDEEFVKVLRETLVGKTINGHAIEVRQAHAISELKSCRVVFFRAGEKVPDSVLSALIGAGELLVGEEPKFLAQGGMINLSLKDGRISYEVNPEALERGGVRYGQSSAPGEKRADSGVERAGQRAVRTQVAPDYPSVAKSMSLVGTVQLLALVSPDGTVKEVHVLGGHPLLALAAEQAVKKWRYEPAPRETHEIVRISFSPN